MTIETKPRENTAQKAMQMLGIFLLVSGFAFNFYATASIAQQWDWDLGIPFYQAIPIHANGALIGLVSAVIGVGILFTLSVETRRERALVAGLFSGLLIAGGLVLKFGPLF